MATSEPAKMPMIGAQSRRPPRAFSMKATTTARVVAAQSGAPNGLAPAGTLLSCWKITGITVTGVSIRMVPVTVGVRMRRNRASRAEKANCRSAMASTKAASSGGPPASRAAMLTPMAAPEAPVAMR